MDANQQSELIGPLLRDVSRSFYLTLRVLPAAIRPQISLAYLLARATDTIADTRAVSRQNRLEILRAMHADLSYDESLTALREHQTLPAEMRLLERLPDCLAMLETFSEADRSLVRELLHMIICGQIFDLEKFPGESEREPVALRTDNELDQYTYMVAGCVGEFWTKMCVAHLPALRDWELRRMCELGVRFGKGLQLVNILRDIPRDLRIGRCYLPVSDPRALLVAENFETIRPQYTRWLERAVEHLDAGRQYTLAIPAPVGRLRLACIWPIWIGLKTIGLLRRSNPLDPATRIKVSRSEVYGLVVRSVLTYRSDRALSGYFERLRRGASSAS